MLRLALGSVAGLLGTLLLVFAWFSYPGRPRPFLDARGDLLPGSLAEKIWVDINGFSQGMFIESHDVNNPVLLYLHGGMPEYFLERRYPTGLAQLFTVVWWEQRGTGLSFNPDLEPESITSEQLVLDTLELTKYLRARFGREKVFLMAHSGGTFIGIQAAARRPEWFEAYIGVAQMGRQLVSEVTAYEHMLLEFEARGESDWVSRLRAWPVTLEQGVPEPYLRLRDPAMHRLGVGTMHDMTSVVTGIFLASLETHEYSVSEKVNLWRGKAHSGVSPLWQEILATDLRERTPEVGVPVYLLSGVHDFTCAYSESRSYFQRLRAPKKGFYTFDHSAHSPQFEEPARFREIIVRDVLAGATSLADAP